GARARAHGRVRPVAAGRIARGDDRARVLARRRGRRRYGRGGQARRPRRDGRRPDAGRLRLAHAPLGDERWRGRPRRPQGLEALMADMWLYDLRVTVERIEGRSVCGLREGDYFELVNSSELRLPEGRHFCVYALQAVLPLL